MRSSELPRVHIEDAYSAFNLNFPARAASLTYTRSRIDRTAREFAEPRAFLIGGILSEKKRKRKIC